MVLDSTTVHFIPFFRIQHYLDELRTEPERLFQMSEKEVIYNLMQPPDHGRRKKRDLYSKGGKN
jgi:hypothetical protein